MSWISPPTLPSKIYLEHLTYFLLMNSVFVIFQLAISFLRLLYKLRDLKRYFKGVFHHFSGHDGITKC